VLVEINYIGLEPAMRGWMNDSRPTLRRGDRNVMRAFAPVR